MMKLVCSIFDRKARTFGAPMLFQNEEIAKRMAITLLRSGGQSSDLEKFPDDFDLYAIGEFDEDLGIVAGVETPRFLFTFGALLGGGAEPGSFQRAAE